MRIRTWTVTRSVIVGGALGLITATVVIFGFVVSHRTSIATTTAFADVEFSRLRARFMNQEPLVDMSRRVASRASAQSVISRAYAHSIPSFSTLAAASGSFASTCRIG